MKRRKSIRNKEEPACGQVREFISKKEVDGPESGPKTGIDRGLEVASVG